MEFTLPTKFIFNDINLNQQFEIIQLSGQYLDSEQIFQFNILTIPQISNDDTEIGKINDVILSDKKDPNIFYKLTIINDKLVSGMLRTSELTTEQRAVVKKYLILKDNHISNNYCKITMTDNKLITEQLKGSDLSNEYIYNVEQYIILTDEISNKHYKIVISDNIITQEPI